MVNGPLSIPQPDYSPVPGFPVGGFSSRGFNSGEVFSIGVVPGVDGAITVTEAGGLEGEADELVVVGGVDGVGSGLTGAADGGALVRSVGDSTMVGPPGPGAGVGAGTGAGAGTALA